MIGLFRRSLAKLVLKLGRWQVVGTAPTARKAVIIAAPHTSNWDFVYLLAGAWTLGFEVCWVGKHSLFGPPFGWFFRALGGVGVNRTIRQNAVQQIAEEFSRRDQLMLAIGPEGTRKYASHWKSGFYHVAQKAGVPFLPSFLDYGTRRLGVGEAFYPSGDAATDMDRFRAFYRGTVGKYPEKTGAVRLKCEDDGAADCSPEYAKSA